MAQAYVEPLQIPIIKETCVGKSDKCFIKMKFRRDPTSITPDLYEFSMSIFDDGDPEEFLLLMRNFNMTLASSGTLETGANIQYFHTLARGKALRHFDPLSADL